MSQACSEMPGYERGTSPNVASSTASARSAIPTVMTRLARCVVRPRMPTATTAVKVANSARQEDRAEDGRCQRHVLLELEGEETAEDRGDTLSEVDDPGRAIDEHERHPDDPEDGPGRDADHDQLQERRHARRLEPSPR